VVWPSKTEDLGGEWWRVLDWQLLSF